MTGVRRSTTKTQLAVLLTHLHRCQQHGPWSGGDGAVSASGTV